MEGIVSIHHKKKETPAERKRRIRRELRRNHEDAKQGLIDASEEGSRFPEPKKSDTDIPPPFEPPPAA
jgi:hypothetical protein